MSDSSGSAGGQNQGGGFNMATRVSQASGMGRTQDGKVERSPHMRNVDMTAEERRQWEKENPGEFGPGTVIEESTGRVFLRTQGRQEGEYVDILAPAYTRERLQGRSQPRSPSSRAAPERTTGRRSGGGGSGSTTLLTPEGLGRGRSGRTVLGA